MNGERHRRLHEIFRAACELAGDERERCLDRMCAGDPALRAAAVRLLNKDSDASGFLETPVGDLAGALARDDAPMPAAVGRYRVLRRLGEGGMGVVYLAEQDNPRRSVALKVLRPGTTTPSRLSRFTHEAQVLARLQHPGIAQVYEAGADDSGAGPQPYFVMEYIEGRPLTEYAESQKLQPRARLELMAQVCHAAHHAHQKGVIHRDLKPANILVTSAGQPKILDFGVARASDADVQTATMHTGVGELLGTLPYMSPEQTSGDPEEIDIRCDVYALGVIAYELLTGRTPHDLGRRPVPEALRIIREDAPVPIATGRPHLRGDIETIVLKALEKDRRRRYSSAAAMAEDIERYLRNEPILARPASAIYQLRKLARRHTALVASTAAIFGLLVVAVIVTSSLAVELARQRDQARRGQSDAESARAAADEARHAAEAARQAEAAARVKAEREARVANAVGGFLEDIFSAGSPYVGRHDMTVAEALDIAAQRVGEKLAGEPEVAASVRQRLSDTYYSLGKLDAALEQARQSLAHLGRLDNPSPAVLVQGYSATAQVLLAKGEKVEAETLLRAADALAAQSLPADDPLRLTVMTNYGALLFSLGRYDEAEPLMSRTYEQRLALHGAEHPYTLTALNNLANVTRRIGRVDEGERLMRLNMERHRAAVGDRHPNTITGIYNYADLLRELGRHAESERLFSECVDLGLRHLPTGHWLIGLYRSGFGEMLRETRRFDEAEPHLLEGYRILRHQLGAEHERTLRAARRIVTLYEDWERPDSASEWRARLQPKP
ncbi:MAG TPA: serine/threonine-protein kinase [Phycisphaerae bacterium]|nr:serine/threonine-protein kinase [Phycisphaerae bacterium]